MVLIVPILPIVTVQYLNTFFSHTKKCEKFSLIFNPHKTEDWSSVLVFLLKHPQKNVLFEIPVNPDIISSYPSVALEVTFIDLIPPVLRYLYITIYSVILFIIQLEFNKEIKQFRNSSLSGKAVFSKLDSFSSMTDKMKELAENTVCLAIFLWDSPLSVDSNTNFGFYSKYEAVQFIRSGNVATAKETDSSWTLIKTL